MLLVNIEIKIDENCTEPRLILITSNVTDEVNEIIKRLSSSQLEMLIGFKNEELIVLNPNEIYRAYALNGKVYAETENSTLTLKLRLYEVEERLKSYSFVRISNGDIVNLKKIKGFDLSLTATIRVTLLNGTVTYVSRRYVAKIKKLLGI